MSKIVIDGRIITSSTGRYVAQLLEQLQQLDTKNDYVVLVRSKADWWPEADNFSVVEAPFPDFTFAEQLKLLKVLKELKPDLVHFPMPQYPLLYRGARINTIHDTTMLDFKHPHWNPVVDGIKRLIFRVVFRWAAIRSDKVIVPTLYVKRELIQRYPVDPLNITVTYEADMERLQKPKQVPQLDGKKFLLYVGHASPYKNLWRLAQAFQAVKKEHEDVELVFVGKETNHYKRLRQKIDSQRLRGIRFLGFVPDQQLAWLYQHALAYTFPSLSEGFGLPGLEAMEYDCPVVSSSATCLPEVYGDAALYFDPLDTKDMAKKLSAVVNKPALRQSLIAAGQLQRKKYTWRKTAEETLAVYREVLENPK